MTMGVGTRAAAGLAALLALTAPALGADASVLGCNERLAGEVGIRELLGDVGDTVGVAVTVHTTGPVDAFALDVSFPESVLSFDGVATGNLTAGWTLSAAHLPALHVVRVGGFSASPIPSGAIGRLAVLRFRVDAAGVDSFATGSYLDDLAGYTACESVHAPTAVAAATWGRVKGLYR
ncbi:MAG: cohesin domain-containing protein [Candidatus Eiseniibacteriota bacterium]